MHHYRQICTFCFPFIKSVNFETISVYWLLNFSSTVMHISYTGLSRANSTVDNVITYLKCAAVPSLRSDKADIVPGYDFLVNSVWPEMIKGIEERLSYLFNPGNPDMFYEVHPQ